ncbi:MAG: ASCH domain-containing protein [Prevotellaceae bacterium]|jgi:hypothetical protein|nr:ASCH domain-containing protein [Prevotellaceae bacterium]
MKVLTVKNPWASLIISGGKDVENRTWKTNYRGRILVHSSIRRDTSCNAYFRTDWSYVKYVKFLLDVAFDGCVIGSVELADCVQNSTSRWAEKDMWHWILKDPKPLVPIPAKGRLGLWEYALLTDGV